jgi:cobalt-zinc-cadmium efflux system membrane fusion protein
MHTEKLTIFLFGAAFLFVCGCSRPYSDSVSVIETDSTGKAAVIFLSEERVKKSGIRTDSAYFKSTTRVLTCPGYVLAETEHAINMPSPVEGKITELYAVDGHRVKSGSLIAVIENSDFIILQQEFLESKNLYEFYREEYSRQGDLTVENATSIKKMQIARRDYQSAELIYNSLTLQLKLLGILPDSVNASKMSPRIPVYSSIAGTVTSIPVYKGMYIRKGDPLLKLSPLAQKPLIRFTIPEEAVAELHKGKTISCVAAFDTLKNIEVVVESIYTSMNSDSYLLTVIGHVKSSETNVIPGMSVYAKIPVNAYPRYTVLPHSIISAKSGNYIFARYNNQYHKIKVKTTTGSDERINVAGLPSEMADSVVVSGINKLSDLFGLR